MKNLESLKLIFSAVGKATLSIFFMLLFYFQVSAFPGRLDLSFQNALLNGADVRQIEVQPDGKILIAGTFTTRGAAARQNFARLNADGSVDATFAPAATASLMKVQNDGKILIAGYDFLKRLNADGSLDSTFNVSGIVIPVIFDIELQPDGKILVSSACGMNLNCSSFVTRLNPNGSVDLINGAPFRFAANSGVAHSYKIAYVPSENKILVGGTFSQTINGAQSKGLARLNPDGSVDQTFVADLNLSMSNYVFSIDSEPLANGKIIVWGEFGSVNQTTRRGLAVLNSNGSVDASFVPAFNNLITSATKIEILSVAAQSDGKIIVGGDIYDYNGGSYRTYFTRLNTDGSFDRDFNWIKNQIGRIFSLKIHLGNRLLVGGAFYRFNGFQRRHGLARINLL